ncbi:MAG: hypothetical protein AAF629_12280 [Chloroflexota bacterium]
MSTTPKRGDKIGEYFKLDRAIDAPAGSFARVYAAEDLQENRQVAIKILRHKHLDLPKDECEQRFEAFNREAELLLKFDDDPRVMNLYGVGYLWKSYLLYEAKHLGTDIEQFRAMRDEAMANNWLPYLIIEPCRNEDSLHQLVVHNPRGVRLPMIEAVELALQLTDLLVKIHDNDIIYWDAKPAHAFWNGEQLKLIDWNVSYPLTEEYLAFLGGTKEELKKLDILILGRQFIYPAFIGLDFQTGQQPPSAGTTSANVVKETQAFYYRGDVQLYGGERFLDPPVQAFLSRVVQSDEFDSAAMLREELENYAVQLGWRFTGKFPNAQATEALEHKRQALKSLRAAHAAITNALDEIDNAHNVFESADTNFLVEQTEALFKRSVIP